MRTEAANVCGAHGAPYATRRLGVERFSRIQYQQTIIELSCVTPIQKSGICKTILFVAFYRIFLKRCKHRFRKQSSQVKNL